MIKPNTTICFRARRHLLRLAAFTAVESAATNTENLVRKQNDPRRFPASSGIMVSGPRPDYSPSMSQSQITGDSRRARGTTLVGRAQLCPTLACEIFKLHKTALRASVRTLALSSGTSGCSITHATIFRHIFTRRVDSTCAILDLNSRTSSKTRSDIRRYDHTLSSK